jgi:Fe-S-cluster containining protein
MVECLKCGLCCRVLFLVIAHPSPELLEYYEARKWSYDKTTKLLSIPDICPHLVDNKCDIYENRPEYCRNYPLKIKYVNVPKGCAFEKVMRRRVIK